ncbi:MAG: M48 family metallopeptidase, partial [Lacisediminimonas sp.]|nr:M48 family metallopeptidase [Lacisediminimonas sp.]
MSSQVFSVVFVGFLLLSLSIRFWLSSRQIRHVLAHRDTVPPEFAERIALSAHQKAADYTVAKGKFGLVMMVVNTAVLIGFTLLGGLQWLSMTVLELTGPGMLYQLALIAAFVIISGLVELPFDYYKQFRLEQRFGFNKMTKPLFFSDMVKGIGLGT